MASLIVRDAKNGKVKEIPLNKRRFTIGKSDWNDLVLPREPIAKEHCVIFFRDDKFQGREFLTDEEWNADVKEAKERNAHLFAGTAERRGFRELPLGEPRLATYPRISLSCFIPRSSSLSRSRSRVPAAGQWADPNRENRPAETPSAGP